MTSKWTSVADARRKILTDIVAVDGVVSSPVTDALLRVIAEDIIAPFNVPGHDNSAMDGFACRLSDVAGGGGGNGDAMLRVVGAAFAGHPFNGGFAAGECVKIMTGAPLPAGTEIVIPQEETSDAGGGNVLIRAAPKRRAGTHMRLAGEDLASGETALAAGSLCLPAEIGLLASLGIETAMFKRPLRVAFFSTGDEVRAGGSPLAKLARGDVYDSNRHTLRAMLQRMGFDAIDFGIVGDERQALADALGRAAADADVIITSGGASVGEADHIRAVLAELGEVRFWKVAMRPGRPLAYGKIGNTDFFGLPGNPVSVMVCFYQFVREALWKRAGRSGGTTLPTFPAITTTPLRKAPGRMEFQRGVLSQTKDGENLVTVTGDQGSGILSSMTRANCFIVLPDDCGGVAAGEKVQVQMFEGIV